MTMDKTEYVVRFYEEELRKKTRDYATLLAMYSESQQEIKQLQEQLKQQNNEKSKEE